ncbi:molybdopterin-dependent oxidoreductase [Thermodesulfobacteriota bacterium]
MSKRDKKKIPSIRDYLKASGRSLIPSAGSDKMEDGWYPGVCLACMQGDCLERVHVVDGLVVELDGEKRSPNNQGRICAKGMASIAALYSPWRIKAPMKRTNPNKGLDIDPGWVEITWEEAIDLAAEKIDEARKKDPRTVICMSGFGNIGASFTTLKGFAAGIGTPNNWHTYGAACALHFGMNYTQGAIPEIVADMANCKYILSLGNSIAANKGIASPGARETLDAIERGTRVIYVDPRCSFEAAKSGEWVPIKPATDLAFLMGIIHTILYEIGKFDEWFVKTRTNAPYLVDDNTGYFVCDPETQKPLMWDEEEGEAKPFDDIDSTRCSLEGLFNVNGISCRPAFVLFKESLKERTPEWAGEITTIPAETTRRIAAELVENAHIGAWTEIEGFRIPYTPIAIQYGRGAYNHTVIGPMGDLAGKILQMLLGALEVVGGAGTNQLPNSRHLKPGPDGTIEHKVEAAQNPWVWPPQAFEQPSFYPVSHTLSHIGAMAVLDPEKYHMEYTPEVMLAVGTDPIHSNCSADLWVKAIMKIPYVITMNVTFGPMTMLSDLLLPDNHFLERPEYSISTTPYFAEDHNVWTPETRGSLFFPRRDTSKIRSPYNTRDAEDVIMDIAEKLDILYGPGNLIDKRAHYAPFAPVALDLDLNKKPTRHDIASAFAKQVFKYEGDIDDITDETGPWFTRVWNGGPEAYNYYFYPDSKTRHPLYMDYMKWLGDDLRKNMKEAGIDSVPGWENNMDQFWAAWSPTLVWYPTKEQKAPKEFDLLAINYKTATYSSALGQNLENPELYEVCQNFEPYDYVCIMNADTASKKGLKNSDTIVVESMWGKTIGKLKTSELFHPSVVSIPSCHGKASPLDCPVIGEGPDFAALVSVREEDGAHDPITGGYEQAPAVKVYKA